MKTKKYSKIITAILLVSLLASALFACLDSGNDTHGKMTLVLLDGDNAQEYVVDLSKLPSGDSSSTGLMAVLDYLQDEGKLTYDESGGFLNRVGDLKNNENNNNMWISIYTDVESDVSVAEWATTVTYKGVRCTSSDFGANQMSVKNGCTIIVTLIYFG